MLAVYVGVCEEGGRRRVQVGRWRGPVGGAGVKEAQQERARSGGQSTSLSVATQRGLRVLACLPASELAVREVQAAWSEMCDFPFVAALLRPWRWSEMLVSGCGVSVDCLTRGAGGGG
jgi:hypothetical protein